MSAKGAHVQDSSVLERRLRPIYDWLDAGNYKKAIQECDKVLKKSPNLDRARALKALSLLRLGKEAECTAILDALTAQTPSDDATLQAMTMCYRELQQLDRVSKLYEAAVKLDPTNEELHTHLFMSYVRVSDFKQQQQSALMLFKLTPKNPYYCWAVMSVILQATKGDGAKDLKKRTLLLSLAERMIDKMISENKFEAEQEVQLYTMVLEEQGKYEKVLEVLEGPLGSKLSGDSTQNKLPILIKLNRWSDVNLLCKKSLTENMDRWDIWKHYLKSVFELYNASKVNNHTANHEGHADTSDLDIVDDTPEKAHEFICNLVESGSENGFLLRGPYLARFELCKQLDVANNTDLLGDTIELFMEYFRKFGHKPCCVSDLRSYLTLLDNDKRVELAAKLVKDVGISSTSVPQSEQQMQRHICALQLSRLCGSHSNLNPEHLKALVTAFSFHYLHGYQTYGQDLLSTDQAPADSYTLLAAHLLYDLHRKTESSQPLLLALVLLNHTLKNSPSNFHIKLLILRLSHILGCTYWAHLWYESLDIKHLQLDSMCYVHCARLMTTGCFFLSSALYDATLKFFSTNYKDSSENLTFSYKFGSFIKLTEFMDFRERLNNSLHYTTIAVDRLFLSIVQCSSNEQFYALETTPRDDPVDWESIRNNSDYNVYISWDPERATNGPIDKWPEIKEIAKQDIAFLKLRVAILFCIQATLHILKQPGEVKNGIEQLQEALNKWKIVREEVDITKYQPVEMKRLCMPFPSRLHGHLKAPYGKLLPAMFEIVCSLCLEDPGNCENILSNIKQEFSFMVDNTCNLLNNDLKASDIYLQRRENLEYISNIVEICSISTILCVFCLEMMKNSQTGKKTKRKAWDSKLREIIVSLVTTVKDEIVKLDSALKKYEEDMKNQGYANIADELSEKLATLNLSIDEEDSVINKLSQYSYSITEIRTVLKNKLKLLTLS